MTIEFDLHVHSRFSDGLLSPEALCTLAIKRKLRLLALCDHDTTDGLAPMCDAVRRTVESGHSLDFLPSIELSTGSNGRTHVLGYGVDESSAELQAVLTEMRRKRLVRGRAMLERLRELGVTLPPEVLPPLDREGMALGRAHIARALIAVGLVSTTDQAFDRYLGAGRPAYVPLEHLTTAEAVELLTRANAVPVLAHPMRIGLKLPAIEALAASLSPCGLRGIEAYHPSASHANAPLLESMARRLGLLVTGGSDFHGDSGARAILGGVPSGWHRRADDLQALCNAASPLIKAP